MLWCYFPSLIKLLLQALLRAWKTWRWFSYLASRRHFLLRLLVSLPAFASCVASAGVLAFLSSCLQAQRTDAAAGALQAGQPGTEVLREVIRGAAAATDMDSREADRLATALASDQQLGQVR